MNIKISNGMKKITKIGLMLVVLVGVFCFIQIKPVSATDPQGSCTMQNNPPFTSTQAACKNALGQFGDWEQYGYCDLPNGTNVVYTQKSCTQNGGTNWSTTSPVQGWCDVPGDQVYSNWTSYACSIHVPKGNWTSTAPAIGWCTVSGTTQAASGWTQYDCQAYPGTWSATDPSQTSGTGTTTGGATTSGTTTGSTTTSGTTTGSTTTSGTTTSGSGMIVNPIPSVTSVPGLIQTILQGVLKIGIPIVALAIIYCGFLFVFARGNSEKLTKAKDALLYTLIGAAILLGAWAIATMISTTVLGIAGS